MQGGTNLKEYLAKADEAERLAEAEADPVLKANLASIAESWRGLADLAGNRERDAK